MSGKIDNLKLKVRKLRQLKKQRTLKTNLEKVNGQEEKQAKSYCGHNSCNNIFHTQKSAGKIMTLSEITSYKIKSIQQRRLNKRQRKI